ncbi:hypothetical protein WA026_023481 [Henosepilachna vigintioctopunctata]|uniref:Codanin-1 C-terminal domain-containing protein n=1 Tax=Henosepilachna vigintioctopunctata TaxID=420089 RepID=A0AAW1V470_9CUCU
MTIWKETVSKRGNSFNFENNINNESVLDEEVNRDFLKKEIEKLSVNRNTIGENILVQMKVKSENQTRTNRKIIPNPKLVRFKKELEKVILIYETLLLKGLVFSYIGELHFVISLLFNEHCESDETDFCDSKETTVTFQEIFRNYHNVIFFASCILERSIFYLKSFDKSTLKYLCGNELLRIYSPNLISTLDKISEKKEERLSKLYESDFKQNICFVLDTDNRTNFPSDISFQSFKKQRDMFYEILKIWEDGHMIPGWSFEYSLGRRIRVLLGYHKDTVNLMRLSRLFMDQLLSTCGRNAVEEIFTETSGSILTSLPNIDKDKFDRLKTRLVTKQSSSSDTVPEFTGYQEFYKEFILFSSNPNFLRHLCDTFISEIIELNDTTFNNLDTESNEYETDLNTKKAFVNCLKSLRILAKFLGFTESLPYKNETSSVSSNLMELQIKIRNRVKPNFDVMPILQSAIINGNLVLSVPWICKYLSTLDTVTLKTKYYMKVIEMLISIYRNIRKTEFSLPEYNIYLIKYSLGWLFEQNHFPISIFFEKINFKHDFFPVNGRSANLDNLVIVDQNILYIFCFYLDKIKILLTSKTTVRDRITVRHITPLTAVESPKEFFRKKIEMQLEEAFFNGHPSSIKKTVDFVAERIASTCVKYLCYHIVPEFKKRFTKELQTKLKSWSKEGEGNTKTDVRAQCEQLAEENLRMLVKLCNDEVDKIIESNLKNAIHSMVPMDFLPQMEHICICASKRICLEKVKQWTSSHIITNILTKDIGSEIAKWSNEDPKVKSKPMFVLPAGGSNNSHSENTETAAHILDKLRVRWK